MVAITRQPHALAGGILPARWPGIIEAKMNVQQSVIHVSRDAVRNRCQSGHRTAASSQHSRSHGFSPRATALVYGR